MVITVCWSRRCLGQETSYIRQLLFKYIVKFNAKKNKQKTKKKKQKKKKTENFQTKNWYFHISAQNIDYGTR